jgi:hypothetical protein
MRDCGQHRNFTRRSFLFGAASAANFALLNTHADAETTMQPVAMRNTAKTCVFINLAGAPSQLDTFAPKDGPWNLPDADLRQYPGGIVLSQKLWPNISRLAGDMCVLRSVRSVEAVHERGQFYLQTTHSFNPSSAADLPHIGAVCAKERAGTGVMSPFVAVNAGQIQGSAILDGKFSPFTPSLNRNGIPTLQHCCVPDPKTRFQQRLAFLDQLEAPLVKNPFSTEAANLQSYVTAARGMMYNDAIAASFKFSAQEEARYGNTDLGRSLIVIRNLVRAKNGAVFLTTTFGGWDLHFNMYDPGLRGNFLSQAATLDRAVYEFISDLKSSGDLASTLVLMMGEFGRGPGDLNPRGGRDHWPDALCAVMMGGGVKGGRTIGDMDSQGAYIVTPGWSADREIFMEDIAATIYSALGVNWTKETTDTPTGRLYEYVPGSSRRLYQPVDEVFA